MTKNTKKKGLFTDKDRQGLANGRGLDMGRLHTDKDKKQGLAEKKGLNIGSLLSEEDKKKGLFTDKDREGLM